MKTKTIPLLLILLAAAPLVHARPGETVEQLHKRYGAPVEVVGSGGTRKEKFRAGGMNITVQIVEGVSGVETFTRPDGEKFSEADINAILDANRSSNSWRPLNNLTPDDPTSAWRLDNDSLIAFYSPTKKNLILRERPTRKKE